jgi:hypothetical protein
MSGLKGFMRIALAVTLAFLLVGGAQAATAPLDKSVAQADVSVVVLPKAPAEGYLIYDVTAVNRGHQYAKNMMITVPFDAAALKLFDTTFAGNAGWIKQVKGNDLIIHIPRLDASGKTVATLRFTRLPGAAADAALTERATFVWTDGPKTGQGSTNIPQPVAKASYPLGMSEIAGAEMPTMQFGTDLFAPGEPVSFWCNMPDGEIHALLVGHGADVALQHRISKKDKEAEKYGEYLRANDNGAFSINFAEEDLTPFSYSVVAFGHLTGLAAVAPFTIK